LVLAKSALGRKKIVKNNPQLFYDYKYSEKKNGGAKNVMSGLFLGA